jgi:hypothetical protein
MRCKDGNHAALQVTNVNRARLKFGALFTRNLNLATGQSFGIGNRVNADKLQNNTAFVVPEALERKLTPDTAFCERKESLALCE